MTAPIDVLVFDTETTGLPLHDRAPLDLQPQCIEFGAALLSGRDGSVLEEISLLINPGKPLPPEIVKITGITDADLVDAPPFEAVLPRIESLFRGAAMCVAHNLPFDKNILRFELARLQRADFPWCARELCTVGAFVEQWGRRPKLTELYAATLGRPLAQQHRALSDVRALVEIVQALELWRIDGNSESSPATEQCEQPPASSSTTTPSAPPKKRRATRRTASPR